LIKEILQGIAFFFPIPINVWLLRLTGAKIGKHVAIHPFVLIRAKSIEIRDNSIIKSGTMINVRRFVLGRKSSIGFFTLVKGESDLLINDACIIGPRNLINCSRSVTLDFYSGVGPGSCLYTHGSGMPVTEGYRATFGPIHIKSKVWVSMRCTIGPNVVIGEGTVVLPGTTLLRSIDKKRMATGDPAKLVNLPRFLIPRESDYLEKLSVEILEKYCEWSNEYNNTKWQVEKGTLKIPKGKINISISVNNNGDITLLTEKGATREGIYFNLADLSTDGKRTMEKREFEAFMRLYYGLIYLQKQT
jgi:acetyltransferase-like isoleucine patch superfamily enzyme